MSKFRACLLASAITCGWGAVPYAVAAPVVAHNYKHVLVISVDGLHAVDLANFIQAFPNSNLAQLARHGVVYPNAFTTAPSDSYPGLLAQFTGATPATGGLFYDDSYDRQEYPSVNFWLSQGKADPGCSGQPGAEVTNFEELDRGYNFSTRARVRPHRRRNAGQGAHAARSRQHAAQDRRRTLRPRSIRTTTSAPTPSSRSPMRPASTRPGRTSIPPTRTSAARRGRASTSCSPRRSTRRTRSTPARSRATTTRRATRASAPTTASRCRRC